MADMGMTNRQTPPATSPELYRAATVADVLDPTVRGFYEADGAYWRKNGKVKTWKTRPGHARVPVKFGLRGYGYVDHGNVDGLYVAL